jgi:hypothetical protein
MQTDKEQKKEFRRRVLLYVVSVIVVIVITVIFFFLMIGYRVNPKDGIVQQGGLVQLFSFPSGARVTIGSAELERSTNTKITINPGTYAVQMNKEGFIPWRKDFSVRSGQVIWLNSARLIPKQLQTDTVLTLDRVDDSITSQGSKVMVLLPDKAKPVISVVQLNDDKEVKVKSVNLDGPNFATEGSVQYKLLKLSSDSRRIIMSRTLGKARQILLVDISDPNHSIVLGANENKSYPSEAIFDPRSNGNLIIRYKDGSVYLFDKDSKRLSPKILEKISSMNVNQNILTYVTNVSDGSISTGGYNLDDKINMIFETHRTKQRMLASLGKYYSDYFLVTTIGNQISIKKTDNLSPASKKISWSTVFDKKLYENVIDTGFQDENQIIYFTQTGFMSSYDLESLSSSNTKLVANTSVARNIIWLDKHHFSDDTNGTLRQYEYDGTNQADLTQVSRGQSAGYSTSGKYLYSLSEDKGGRAILQRTKMTLD